MNQIIYSKNLEKNLLNKKKKFKIRYSIIFYSSIALIIYFLSCSIIKRINLKRNNIQTSQILNVYNIQSIFSSNRNSITLENGENIEIIGIIDIDKINLKCPILSELTDELLEIAPCKFSGKSFTSFDNVCIAGHNYKNNTLFSNLNDLSIGDKIIIHDINRSILLLCCL